MYAVEHLSVSSLGPRAGTPTRNSHGARSHKCAGRELSFTSSVPLSVDFGRPPLSPALGLRLLSSRRYLSNAPQQYGPAHPRVIATSPKITSRSTLLTNPTRLRWPRVLLCLISLYPLPRRPCRRSMTRRTAMPGPRTPRRRTKIPRRWTPHPETLRVVGGSLLCCSAASAAASVLNFASRARSYPGWRSRAWSFWR